MVNQMLHCLSGTASGVPRQSIRGLRSIIAELGTSSFNRLRIGIGRAKGRLPNGQEPTSGGSLKDHVLRPFSKFEAIAVKGVEERAAEAVSYWLKNGIDKAMNKYNASLSR